MTIIVVALFTAKQGKQDDGKNAINFFFSKNEKKKTTVVVIILFTTKKD
jgi:hypothetical protein